jgi:hypothetical protein
MLFNPRYGRLGMLAVPYFWLFEGMGPIIEVTGFATFALAAILGTLEPSIAWLFLSLAVLHGLLLSQVAVGVESMLLQRYPRPSDRLILLAAGLLEFLGFHQILTLERFRASFQVRRKRGTWGEMRRIGISESSSS